MSESLPNWDSYLNIASLSDIGMRRSNNQDNLIVSLASSFEQWQKKGHLFIVADGMGAHAAGELASKIAVDHIPHIYARINDISSPEALKKSVIAANTEINRRGQANEDFHNMGTTCSVITLLPQGAIVAHVGDSRVYRLRQNRLEQLTFDHSLVWEMKASGQLSSAEEAAGKIPKNVITRSLGPYPDCKVDLEGPFPLQVGDIFMLCSDGLTGMVEDAEIGAILANLPPKEAARVLVDLANLRGGPDNSTLIIIEITHPKLATNSSTNPIKINAGSAKFGIHPVAWAILIGASLLTALLTYSAGWVIGLIPGIVAVASLIWIVSLMVMKATAGQEVTGGKKFGKAPYTRTNCAEGEQVTKQLADVIHQLQDGAQKQQWKVDWGRLNELVSEAEGASAKGDYSIAISSYGRGISFLMDQLRNQNSPNDSSIEL